MRDQIYISKKLDSIKKNLIIEEDEHSIWLYLLDSENDNKIILDAFVCSTGTIVKKTSEVKGYLDKNFAPPISEKYAHGSSIQNDLTNIDFVIEISGHIVNVFLKNEIYVILDLADNCSYSKSISKAGPYGLPIENMRS